MGEVEEVYDIAPDGRVIVCVEDSEYTPLSSKPQPKFYCEGCVFFVEENRYTNDNSHCVVEADSFTDTCSRLSGVWKEVRDDR